MLIHRLVADRGLPWLASVRSHVGIDEHGVVGKVSSWTDLSSESWNLTRKALAFIFSAG